MLFGLIKLLSSLPLPLPLPSLSSLLKFPIREGFLKVASFSRRKQPTFRKAITGWFLCVLTPKERAYEFYSHGVLLPSVSDGRAARKICFNQSEALPRSAWSHVISIEFLRSFLRRHDHDFGEKPVMVSRNVGYFLRLGKPRHCYK